MNPTPKFELSGQPAEIIKNNRLQISYIRKYFTDSLIYRSHDEKFFFGLPHPYLVPDHRHFREFFYWDTFFMFIGLLEFSDTKKFCEGIIKNFAYEMKRFGRIPNSNAYFSLSRSQTPYFALTIWEYLKKYPKDINKKWIGHSVEMAVEEYNTYWLSDDKRYAYHLTNTGLSRYWDINCDSDLFAEYESGWDTTSRFGGECMQINPIDLNSQLYIYENFFSWYFSQKKQTKKSEFWNKKMKMRKSLIDKYSWDDDKKIYFDYHFNLKKQTKFVSAASFFPFFAGFPDKSKATGSLPNLLKLLEYEGGIAATEKVPHENSVRNQWDYPHGWAPLQYIAFSALKNYGYKDEANRIKNKWLKLCNHWFSTDSCFYEKYNVAKIGSPIVCSTPARPGFGWTNGIYLKFIFHN